MVIIGAGFGGLACAKALGGAACRVTVVDCRNHHLFQPLLYQVATAALSPANIALPVREILRRHRNIEVLMGEVVGIDTETRTIRLRGGRAFSYDRLVIATGSTYSYFGHDDWASVAPGLKSLDNARTLRSRLLAAFEEAEATQDTERRAALMTSVVVGGGPTGVEMAGAIAELARCTLPGDFRHIDPREAQILLVEAGPRLLSTFPEHLADYARRVLEDLGVTVLTRSPVEDVTPDGVMVGGRFIPAGAVIWGAGVRASPVADWLGVGADKAGRVAVDPDLSVPGLDHVYVLGDAALVRDGAGEPLPGLAQVAKQQGEYLGRMLRRAPDGAPRPPFRFRNRGNTAVIGRNAAVFDFGRWQLKGRLAWLLWAVVHVYLLVGFENRLLVSMQWLWRYFTNQRGARLIA